MPDQPVDQSAPQRGSRLSADDWMDAAVEILVADGIEGLKISRLSARLGVTKGSFYWHFTDIGAMKAALSDHVREVQSAAAARIEAFENLPPAERIEAMVALVSDPRRWGMEAAMRRWAETDASIADSVSELDDRTLHIANQALHELGFSDTEAHARATTLLYAGIGFVHAHGRLRQATSEDLRIFINILTRR
ncbi:TetR family transcriptional regulator [Gordonia jinghuaiqii]|uniref:TetR/AcrR family transcriptional regulator n=1 Tax=Gordonia jinghuaiqii TaxID=2758710 RepID=A0A7D7QJT7_9ACTN|nr:TetR/AcrR family transcriptional regulator [Gordonia jinghuaiqii]MCR5976160.1 TetR family transcriptional regulator [Gordonia jinghuaiqii]QMT03404.1 TetR/AcrR family transcriptional regulator [Gordonia jinghuaiqii]